VNANVGQLNRPAAKRQVLLHKDLHAFLHAVDISIPAADNCEVVCRISNAGHLPVNDADQWLLATGFLPIPKEVLRQEIAVQETRATTGWKMPQDPFPNLFCQRIRCKQRSIEIS